MPNSDTSEDRRPNRRLLASGQRREVDCLPGFDQVAVAVEKVGQVKVDFADYRAGAAQPVVAANVEQK